MKEKISITIDGDVLKTARKCGINISQECEIGVRRKIEEIRTVILKCKCGLEAPRTAWARWTWVCPKCSLKGQYSVVEEKLSKI